ncbi:MAG TPA: tetratricopeptide repeat protein [Candidatus Binatia bacterium]
MAHDPYQEFRQAVDRPEDKIDLGRAALTVALTDYPDLDIAAYLGRIDRLAVEVMRRSDSDGDVYHSIAALNHVLFGQHGFRGNRDDYYNPKNSFLNDVIDRKTGIPITLSVLYIEVARRIGIALEGVGFPGHFLVKYGRENEQIFIDPFDQGEIKSPEELSRMLDNLSGRKVALKPQFLESTSNKQILERILMNLKAIYLRNHALGEALSVLDRLIILDPVVAEEIRDRGMVYLQLECFSQAREDFESYLRLAPNARDAAAIRDQVVSLATQVTQIH